MHSSATSARTLLVRSPTGVRPTAAGTRLLEHADVILGAVAAAERDLTLLATARPGVVRVASFASAAAAILPLAFARFRTLCPDVAWIWFPPIPRRASRC